MRRYIFLIFALSCIFSGNAVAQEVHEYIKGDKVVCPGSTVDYTANPEDGETFNEWILPLHAIENYTDPTQPTITITWKLSYNVKQITYLRYSCDSQDEEPDNPDNPTPQEALSFCVKSTSIRLFPVPFANFNASEGDQVLIIGSADFALGEMTNFSLSYSGFSESSVREDLTYYWSVRTSSGATVKEYTTSRDGLSFLANDLATGSYTLSCQVVNACGSNNSLVTIQEYPFNITCQKPAPITGVSGSQYYCIGHGQLINFLGANDATYLDWEEVPGVTVSRVNGAKDQFMLTPTSTGLKQLKFWPVFETTDPECQSTPKSIYVFNIFVDENIEKISQLVYTTIGTSGTFPMNPEGSQALTLNTCQERINGCSQTLRSLDVEAVLGLGDDFAWSGTAFTASLDLILTPVFTNGGQGSSLPYSLAIHEGAPEKMLHLKWPKEQLAELRSIVVQVRNYTYGAGGSSLERDKIQLKVFYREEKEQSIENINISSLSLSVQAGQREQVFHWLGSCPDIANYQFQLLKVIEDQPAPGALDIRWQQSLSLETNDPLQQLKVTIGQGTASSTTPGGGSGKYYWRVRPLGNKDHGIANPQNSVGWENFPIASFDFVDPDDTKSWMYGRVISEGNTQKESVTYANGLQQVSHQITRLNTQKEVYAVQTLQDYLGRNAVSSLPIPVGDKLKDAAGQLLKKADGTPFRTQDFDEKATLRAPFKAYDAAGYYGKEGQAPSQEYIPAAEGIPYQRVLFTEDGSGRVKEQASPGTAHSLPGGHTIRTFYGTSSRQELEALFGPIQAPLAKNVQKIITLDPNNTASVQYIDKAGKTIATALSNNTAGDIPLKPLNDTKPVQNIVETFDEEEIAAWGAYGSTSKKVITISEPTEIHINYTLTPKMLAKNCGVLCQQCDYQVEFILKSLDDDVVDLLLAGPVIAGSLVDCSTISSGISFNHSQWLNNPGRYVVEKRIRSYTSDPVSGKLYIDAKLEGLRTQYNQQYDLMWQELNPFLQGSSLTALYDFLKITKGLTLQDPTGSPYYAYPVMGNASECPELFIHIPYYVPELLCQEEPLMPISTYLDYFDEYWQKQKPIIIEEMMAEHADKSAEEQAIIRAQVEALFYFVPEVGSTATPYLPQEYAYSRAEFIAMLENMKNAVHPQNQQQLLYQEKDMLNAWMTLTRNYLKLNTIEAVDIELDQIRPFNMLENFFAQLRVEKFGFYLPSAIHENKLYAYERFAYDPNNRLQAICMDRLWPANSSAPNSADFAQFDAELRQKIYQCVANVTEVPLGENDPNVPTDPKERSRYLAQKQAEALMNKVADACEDKRAIFRDAIEQAFYRNTNFLGQRYVIQGDKYTMVWDEVTKRFVEGTTPLTFTQMDNAVRECQLTQMIDALVMNCKGYGTLSVIENVDEQRFIVGSVEEWQRIQQVLLPTPFELNVTDRFTCGPEYDFIRIDQDPGDILGITSCGSGLMGYINNILSTVNNLGKPTRERTSADQILCPVDRLENTGVGELITNIFASIGPLAKECNYTKGWEDVHDPLRRNYWISVFDDRRLNQALTDLRDPYLFGLIWAGSKSNYIYYGSCYPNPNGFDNPEAGIPMLQIPVNDVNKDGKLGPTTENHSFRLKFYTYNDAGKRVYIRKDQMLHISEPYVDDPNIAYPDIKPTYYTINWNPAYTKVNITLNDGLNTVVPAFIEHNYSNWHDHTHGHGDFGFKNIPSTCGVDYRSFMCFRWTGTGAAEEYPITIPVDFEPYVNDYKIATCEESSLQDISSLVISQQQKALDERLEVSRKEYMATCANTANFQEQTTISYALGYHHFTLYYYDRAGNLMQTVPPAGVKYGEADKHKLKTTYQYNSLGQLVQQNTPDGGTTRFWYNSIGQLRFSQNAKQQILGSYSYTKYDALGRIKEVGESSERPDDFWQIGKLSDSEPISGTQRTHTRYTEIAASVRYQGKQAQRYLQNRVSFTQTENGPGTEDDVYTYYSYDPHGNVEWLVQRLPQLGDRTIRYEYDLISGKVTKALYQEGQPDQFLHRYAYDADNRLQAVYTSPDGVLWDRDASYEYYGHGPLKRNLLGKDRVQGQDYVYTIQGWLKAINHPGNDASLDPAKDGQANTVGKDAFGMSLGYFAGDYSSTAGANAAYASDAYALKAKEDRNLYNGNISTWADRVAQPDNANAQVAHANNPTGRQFVYDELNRIKQSHLLVHGGASWSYENLLADYGTSYVYDANGNINQLSRNGKAAADGALIDELEYRYDKDSEGRLNHNKLLGVTDITGTSQKGQGFKGNSNYTYDALGNLVTEVNTHTDKDNNTIVITTTVDWTVYGKVQEVKTVATKNGSPYPEASQSLKFTYDASGNRIRKRVIDVAGLLVSDSYYLRDASGNVLAIYEAAPSSDRTNLVYRLIEQPLYGSDRLGQRRASLEIKQEPLLMEQQGQEQQRIGDASSKHWQLAVQAAEGTRLATLNMAAAPQLLSLSNSTGSTTHNRSMALEGADGQPVATLLAGQEDAQAVVLDKNGDLMAGLEKGSQMIRPVKAAPHSPVLSMPVPGASQDYWSFTLDAAGQLLRHRINPAAPGFGSPAQPLGELVQTNEILYKDVEFAHSMALLYDRSQEQGHLFMLQQLPGALRLLMYPQTADGKEGDATQLAVLAGEQPAAHLALSQDGRQLAVLSHMGESQTWYGAGTAGAQLKVYRLSEDYRTAQLEHTHLLYPQKAYGSPAYSASGNYLYFSSREPEGGYAVERLLLNGGSQEVLMHTGSKATISAGPNGSLYAAVAGGDYLLQLSDTQAQPQLLSLGLPEGTTLSGSLPQQVVQVGAESSEVYTRTIAQKDYELKDHLGNVRVLVSDRKRIAFSETGAVVGYRAEVAQATNYYPFGMEMPGRSSLSYRYGFQSQETDKEWLDGAVSFKFRIHDPRIGRFLSIDPLMNKYPFYSPYAFSGNRVIDMRELEGAEPTTTHTTWKPTNITHFHHGTRMQVDGWWVFVTVDDQVNEVHKFYDPQGRTWGTFQPVQPKGHAKVMKDIAIKSIGFVGLGIAGGVLAEGGAVGFLLKEGAESVAEELTGIPIIPLNPDPTDVLDPLINRTAREIADRTRLPVSRGHWSGERGNSIWTSDKPEVNAITGGAGVPFNNGYPNFSQWSRASFEIEGLTGQNSDFSLVYQKMVSEWGFPSQKSAKDWLRENRLTPHHHENGTTIQLIPTDLHGNTPHSGGASILRNE